MYSETQEEKKSIEFDIDIYITGKYILYKTIYLI